MLTWLANDDGLRSSDRIGGVAGLAMANDFLNPGLNHLARVEQ